MKVFWEIIGLIYELINRASQYGEFQPKNFPTQPFLSPEHTTPARTMQR